MRFAISGISCGFIAYHNPLPHTHTHTHASRNKTEESTSYLAFFIFTLMKNKIPFRSYKGLFCFLFFLAKIQLFVFLLVRFIWQWVLGSFKRPGLMALAAQQAHVPFSKFCPNAEFQTNAG